MIEAEIFLDSWKLFDKYALAWSGLITCQQAMELIPFAEELICDLKLNPIGFTNMDEIKIPTQKIKEIIIMKDLEWFREGKGYLTNDGYEYELQLLNELTY